MCMRRLAVCVAALLVGHSSYAEVVLNDGGTTLLNVNTRDRNAGFPDGEADEFEPLSLPFELMDHMVTHGDSSSTADYSFDQQGFAIAFEHQRDGSLDSSGGGFGFIYFSVSTDTPYTLSGVYSAEDPGSTGKAVIQDVQLVDVDTSEVLFRNRQDSFGVVDESFVLGETAGNMSNELLGSIEGSLLAGRSYEFTYSHTIYASNSGDPATAAGNVRLALIPEPAGSLTCGVGALWLLFARRRALS